MAPDLAEPAPRSSAPGATRIDVVPLFLGTGGHVREDLPPLVAQLRAAHTRRSSFALQPADRRGRRGDRRDGARCRRS